MELFRLQYAATLRAGGPEGEAIVAAIMTKALKNNPSLGITGILFFCRETSSLVQILEGPRKNVLDLFTKISADPRALQCTVLEQGSAASRAYAEFGMVLAHTTDPALAAQNLSNAQTLFSAPVLRMQYASTLVAADEREGRAMLEGILQQAVRNNTERKIGGLLAFNPSTLGIVQILEGPAPAVRELYRTIAADPRHVDCTLMSEELLDAAEVLFDYVWGMVQTETHDDELVNLSARIRRSYQRLQVPEMLPESEALDLSRMVRAIDDALYVEATPTTAQGCA